MCKYKYIYNTHTNPILKKESRGAKIKTNQKLNSNQETLVIY